MHTQSQASSIHSHSVQIESINQLHVRNIYILISSFVCLLTANGARVFHFQTYDLDFVKLDASWQASKQTNRE